MSHILHKISKGCPTLVSEWHSGRVSESKISLVITIKSDGSKISAHPVGLSSQESGSKMSDAHQILKLLYHLSRQSAGL